MKIKITYITLFCMIISMQLFAQVPTLLKDIISGNVGGFETAGQYSYNNFPFNVVWQKNGEIFFIANGYASIPNGSNYTNNLELWKSDGTDAGTVMLKDINPGNESSFPTDFIDINGTLYFTAYTNALGRELWKTDGTNGGTVLVKEIMNGTVGGFETAGQYSYNNYSFNVVWQNGSEFYFTANSYATVPSGSSYTNDIELWKSDGTDVGTMRVKDIYPGNESSFPTDFIDINGTLYFTAHTNALGRELWKTDGTNGGTVLVKEIMNGTVGGFETAGTYSYNNYAFNVVWQSGGSFYFTANSYATVPNGSTYTNDVELWKSDGTDAGTMRVKDIYPGNESSYPIDFIDINGTLYFTAHTNALGRELWKTDGTTGGTVLVKEIMNGTVGGFETAGQYFYYNHPFNVVWQSGGSFYFTANSYATVPSGSNYTNDVELWKSDGTDAGTIRVKDIYPGNESSYPIDFIDINGTLYFTAHTNALGRELWKTDGTNGGTVLVKEIMNGTVGGFETAGQYFYYNHPFNVVWQSGGSFYFTANSYATVPNGSTYTNDVELWKSDGTDAGTIRVKDIYPGNESSYPMDFLNISGTLFFTAHNNALGRELWKSDGTTGGTELVKEAMNGTVGGFEIAGQYSYYNLPFSVVFNIGSYFYFLANDHASVPSGSSYTNNVELWKSDGTTANTSKVIDIHPSSTIGSYPLSFTNAIGKIFFTAIDDSHGRELWVIDIPVGDDEDVVINESIKIFPNPSSQQIHVVYKSDAISQNVKKIAVSDIQGREYFNEVVHADGYGLNRTIDIHSLAPGIYVLSLFTDDGILTRKFVRE